MSRKTHLKIKIVNLADESRLIRKEENKSLSAARWCSGIATSKIEPPEGMDWNAGEEARKHYAAYHSLNAHRRGIVREASRKNGLAYACVCGVPYARVEPKVRYDRISTAKQMLEASKKIARNFGGRQDQIDQWYKDAIEHIASQLLSKLDQEAA